MDFAHLRQNKAQKNFHAQKGMNLLPIWSYARTAEFSNLQSMYSDMATELGDVAGHINQMADNNTGTVNNLWYKGEVYSHVVDPAFVFQFNDLRGNVSYNTPIVTGIKGVNTYTLNNIKENDQEYLVKSVPFNIDTPVLSYAVADKPAPDSYSILGASGSGTEIVIPEDNYVYVGISTSLDEVGEDIEGTFFLPEVTLRNKRYEDQAFTFNPYSTLLLRSAAPLPAGTYVVETTLLTDDTTIFIGTWSWSNVFPELSYGFFNEVSRRESFWGLNPTGDRSYLDLWAPPLGGPAELIDITREAEVAKTFVMQDSVGASHEARSLAKPDYMPIIFALSNETDNKIHVYDTYLDQATKVHVNNEEPLLDLECEVIDYRIGDEIVVSTRRAADFMDVEITSVRLRVEEDYTGTTKYLLRDGSVVGASDAWVQVHASLSRYKEQRWRFTITDVGTHKFYLEVKPKGKAVIETASHIMHVGYKAPLSDIDVNMPLGRTLQDVGIWTDGKLYGKDDLGNIYELPLMYNDYFIDYEEYIVYTLSEFDRLELTY